MVKARSGEMAGDLAKRVLPGILGCGWIMTSLQSNNDAQRWRAGHRDGRHANAAALA